jgi:hypothetical protein
VLLLATSIEEIVVRRNPDYGGDLQMFKQTMEILAGRNYVSVVEHGVQAFVGSK